MMQWYGLPAKCGSSQLKPEVAASGLSILCSCYDSRMPAEIQELLPTYRGAESATENENCVKRRSINGWNYKNEKDIFKNFLELN